jgi:hypothetical protein
MSDYLVCALADSPFMVPGSVFDRSCSRCSRKVMLAPSGQNLLKTHRLAIVCAVCYESDSEAQRAPTFLAAPSQELADEVRRRVPNMRRRRN